MKLINKLMLALLLIVAAQSFCQAQQKKTCDYLRPVMNGLQITMPDSLVNINSNPILSQCYTAQIWFIYDQPFKAENYCDYFSGDIPELLSDDDKIIKEIAKERVLTETLRNLKSIFKKSNP